MAFERFAQSTRRVLVVAQQEAQGLGHPAISTGHLLIGLAFVEDGSAGRVLQRRDIRPGAVRRALVEREPMRRRQTEPSPFHRETKAALARAIEAADKDASLEVRTGHLLIAMLADPTGLSAQLLAELGVPIPLLREETQAGLIESAGEGGSGRAVAAATLPFLSFAVWSLMLPENATVVHAEDPEFVREYVVPGTGEGIGQQIATVRRDSTGQQTTITEIIELSVGTRVVLRQVEPRGSAVRITHDLTPVEGGTHVSIEFEYLLPAPGDEVSARFEAHYGQVAHDYLGRLSAALAAGWRPVPSSHWLSR